MNEHVRQERERRGLSVRAAAQAGGVSNTTWSRFEETGDITPKMRRAVSQAFGWPAGWPEGERATADQPSTPDMAALMERMNAILEVGERRGDEMDRAAEAAFAAKAEQEALRALLEAVAASGVRGMTELTAAVHELAVKVDRISRFVDWREAQLTGGRGSQELP